MKAIAEKYFLKDYPVSVKFSFNDIHNKKWVIIEKIPVIGIDYQEDESKYPKEIDIPFKIIDTIKDNSENTIYKIKLLHSIEAENGTNEFEIYANQIGE